MEHTEVQKLNLKAILYGSDIRLNLSERIEKMAGHFGRLDIVVLQCDVHSLLSWETTTALFLSPFQSNVT